MSVEHICFVVKSCYSPPMANTSAPAQSRQPPLRTIRESQGLTLRQVAEPAGLDIGHLSRIERGKAGLTIDALYRLAMVLQLRELRRMLEPYRNGGEGGAKGRGP